MLYEVMAEYVSNIMVFVYNCPSSAGYYIIKIALYLFYCRVNVIINNWIF